jgi:hypothetical protein
MKNMNKEYDELLGDHNASMACGQPILFDLHTCQHEQHQKDRFSI